MPRQFMPGRSYLRLCLGCAVSLLVLGAIGCGSGNPLGRKAVSGRVTLDDQPLEQGSISFEPETKEKGGVRSGATIAAGEYAMTADKGLPPGKYIVRIYASEGAAPAPGASPGGELPAPGSQLPGKSLIPPQYNVKSDLVREVTAGGDNRFDFQLKSK